MQSSLLLGCKERLLEVDCWPALLLKRLAVVLLSCSAKPDII